VVGAVRFVRNKWGDKVPHLATQFQERRTATGKEQRRRSTMAAAVGVLRSGGLVQRGRRVIGRRVHVRVTRATRRKREQGINRCRGEKLQASTISR
jgi:hypothetical protein